MKEKDTYLDKKEAELKERERTVNDYEKCKKNLSELISIIDSIKEKSEQAIKIMSS